MKILKRIKRHWLPIGILFLSIILAFFAAMSFEIMREVDPIRRGPGVTEIRKLSDYFSGLRNTNGDTPVYIMKGESPGGATLVLGGTHPNEPASYITAVCLIEHCLPRTGTLIVIPRAKNSA
ncbi:MAG: succinylglutamate desuccinylase, partial [candidate division KSB1 bacterium]|nr:succinylglutamate desuccinylase [candidate division KSB1 bacterium]